MGFELFSLKGKVALITGATSGIGVSMAEALVEFDVRQVIFVYRPSKDPGELEGKLRNLSKDVEVTGICEDLSTISLADIESKIVGKALEKSVTGQIDILINNAGTAYRYPFEDFPDDKYHEVLHVNLHVPTKLSQLVGRHMIEKHIKGKIVITCSLNSFIGGINILSYAVSKGGVRTLVQALSNEWAKKGICVNGIAPGFIKTNMTEDILTVEETSSKLLQRVPMGHFGEPDDFKGVTGFLCSAASNYVTGELITVDGGWMAF